MLDNIGMTNIPEVDAGKDYRPTTDLRIKRESDKMIYELTMKYEIYNLHELLIIVFFIVHCIVNKLELFYYEGNIKSCN